MSGIRTIDDLRDRCRIESETDCWLWGGCVSDDGVAKVWAFDPKRGQYCVMTARRAAWLLARGPVAGRVVYCVGCTSSICINPDHLAIGTKAKAGAFLAATNRLKGDPARSVINRRNGMKRSKYSPELRAEILASELPNIHLGPKLGMAHTTISNIRRGKRWRETVSGSSIFSIKVA